MEHGLHEGPPCLLEQEWRPVQLSKAEKAAQAALSNGNLTVTMHKGYRMVFAPRQPAATCMHACP